MVLARSDLLRPGALKLVDFPYGGRMTPDPASEQGLYWFDHLTDRFGDPLDVGVLEGVHPATHCAGQACALHAPSDHPLVHAPLN